MRQIKYRVKAENGQEFITPNYEVAAGMGNHIIETILEDVDTRTEKEKAWNHKHMLKIREILEAKRG